MTTVVPFAPVRAVATSPDVAEPDVHAALARELAHMRAILDAAVVRIDAAARQRVQVVAAQRERNATVQDVLASGDIAAMEALRDEMTAKRREA